MRNFVVCLLFGVLLCLGYPVNAQVGGGIPSIEVQQPEWIGGNDHLPSTDLITAAVCDKMDLLGWPDYSQTPSNVPHAKLHLNYQYGSIKRTEHSSNAWNAQPLQFFPDIARFWVSYSQAANDVRTRAICRLKVTGILDIPVGDGRRKIARGHGIKIGALNYLPFEGGYSSVSIPGGSHSSSTSANTSDPSWVTEDEIIQGAVELMMEDLLARLAEGGYSFCPRSQQFQQRIEQTGPLVQLKGGPPDLCDQPSTLPPDGAGRWYYEKSFTATQITTYRKCREVIIWQQLPDGVWKQREVVGRNYLAFNKSTIALRRVTSEAPKEYLQFQL